jgi:NTP pyrophosphatase (non-canonical NTP hydrolase)
MTDLSLKMFQRLSALRDRNYFSGCNTWTLSDYMVALTGEVGEAANIIKKINRGDFTLDEVRELLAEEFADIQSYLPLCATKADIDLAASTIAKFNKVSTRIKSPITLSSPQLWYLASPYTKYIHGYEDACYRVKLLTTELLRYQIPVWSPIVYTHQLVEHGLPIEATNWRFLNEPMTHFCTGCIIYMMQGWEESDGISQEIDWFTENEKPIEYLAEDTIPISFIKHLRATYP